MINDKDFRVPLKLLHHLGDVRGATLKTFIAICSRVEPDGNSPSSSTAQLATMTGLTQRSVFTALSHLEHLGLLKRQKSASGDINQFELLPNDGVHHPGGVPCDGGRAPDPVEEPPADATGGPPDGDTERAVPENAQRSPEALESLDAIIAKVYSSKCRRPDLLTVLDLDGDELRRCLIKLGALGGIGDEAPIELFARALDTIHRGLI